MIGGLRRIGRGFLSFLEANGSFAIFVGTALMHCVRPPIYVKMLLRQLWFIGFTSLPVIGLTAIFTGMVLALQGYNNLSRLNAESAVATLVVLSITRELGPVLAGLMVAGRVAAAIAAEIGTMRVTEQIDALRTLSTNPFGYLVVPRLLAAVIALPLLVLVADIIGVFGGFLIGVSTLGFNPAAYVNNTFANLEVMDVVSGLVKAAVFGMIVALMGCFFGYHAPRGAQGVGQATTNAVVGSSVMIFISNYLLTDIFFAR